MSRIWSRCAWSTADRRNERISFGRTGGRMRIFGAKHYFPHHSALPDTQMVAIAIRRSYRLVSSLAVISGCGA